MSDKVIRIVTEKVIEGLKKGTVAWQKPWSSVEGRPKNMVSGKHYRGINAFSLCEPVSERPDPNWLTMKQIKGLGLRLVKGERYTPVAFWKWTERVKNGRTENIPFVRFYQVYNRQQLEGAEDMWPLGEVGDKPEMAEEDWEKGAALMLKGYQDRGGSHIQFGGSSAFYRPGEDTIGMPNRGDFITQAQYWSTLFHEVVHSTGAKKRLNREMKGFSSDNHAYSKEELVAEMGSCFVMADLGVDVHFNNSVAYLQAWLNELEDDPKLLMQAAQRAEKAYDFIKGVSWDDRKA